MYTHIDNIIYMHINYSLIYIYIYLKVARERKRGQWEELDPGVGWFWT